MLVMENINMTHEFKHPKYYKELRERNKSDQAISDEASTEATSVRPGPGHKLKETSCLDDKNPNPQASSDKLCLLYTSPSPRDGLLSRMPSSA